MAASKPRKYATKMEYFKMDINSWDDDKIRLLEEAYGEVAYARYLKLVDKVYSNSYYFAWTELSSVTYCKRHKYDFDEFNRMLFYCLDIGLFDKTTFYKYGVITSKRIQTHFIDTFERRSNLYLIYEYSILNKKAYQSQNPKVIFVNLDEDVLDMDNLPLKARALLEPEDEFIKSLFCKYSMPKERYELFDGAISNFIPNGIPEPVIETKEQYPEEKKLNGHNLHVSHERSVFEEMLALSKIEYVNAPDHLKKGVPREYYEDWRMLYKDIENYPSLHKCENQINPKQWYNFVNGSQFQSQDVLNGLKKLAGAGIKENNSLLIKLEEYIYWAMKINPITKLPT